MPIRRALVALLLAGWPALAAEAPVRPKVLVLGVDGLDPNLLRTWIDDGSLPAFARLVARGDMKPLATTMPPLSPVAWSTFITGMDPGGHGVYDFIHRDARTLVPYLSMARAVPSSTAIPVGCWVLPLAGGRVDNLRQGRAFWEYLDDAGVPATLFKMPANFPPVRTSGRALSGMGTPDILGNPSDFTYFTDRRVPNDRDISGGRVEYVEVRDRRVRARLRGPGNPFRKDSAECRAELAADFEVFLDPAQRSAKFVVQDTEFVLQEGEWSPWVRVDFEAVPLLASISAIGRFYLQEVSPDFRLYVSSLHINPEDPALPISVPEDWSHELFDALGYFSTKELSEETKAFSAGLFSGFEFWEQSQSILDESRRAFDHLLAQFREGLLFFYFSTVDQGSHMLWRYGDREHPNHVAEPRLEQAIKAMYLKIDDVLGRAMARLDERTTLIVMSDHGFGSFRRQVNLNTWLADQGYIRFHGDVRPPDGFLFAGVDWSRTTAYALGLNGLYVNLQGRESRGIVAAGVEYDALLDRLGRDLLALRDPQGGAPVVTLFTRVRRDFHGPHTTAGPDAIVGYAAGYRSSWKSPLGEFPSQVIEDNRDAWSGDHSNDYRTVPGVLVTNRKITLEAPALYDLTVAILDEYGLPRPEGMIGTDCLGPLPQGP